MKFLRYAACVLATALPYAGHTQEMDQAPVKAFCTEKWADDFAMQAYCTQKIEDGFAAHIEQLEASQNASTTDLTMALNNCQTKWQPQWDMVAYCGQKNIEGILATSEFTEGLPDDVKAVVVSQCADKWGTDFAMRAYCTEKQVTAWRDMQ